MKLFAASIFLTLGTLAIAPAAHAGGTNDMDSFWAIQRGYGFDKAQQPSAPGAFPMGKDNGWSGDRSQVAPQVTGSVPESSVQKRTTRHLMGHAPARRLTKPNAFAQ